jgi:hypothetical protein
MEGHSGMILTGENRKTQRKSCPSDTLSTDRSSKDEQLLTNLFISEISKTGKWRVIGS